MTHICTQFSGQSSGNHVQNAVRSYQYCGKCFKQAIHQKRDESFESVVYCLVLSRSDLM